MSSNTGHDAMCVFYCPAGHCALQHSCWCADGELTAAQFAERHPLWLKLYYAQWLDTDDGRAWLAAMEDLRS